MRKIVYVILLILLLSININVFAEEYQPVLLSVNTPELVSTDKFNYAFVYDTNPDLNGNTYINFSSIHNNKLSKTAVSIDLLLFDEQKKNIGMVTYCSDKDISSDYAGFKLEGDQESSFVIKVVKKYLVAGHNPVDVKYVAVLDENKYCQIGGYDKYYGLTLDQIVQGGYNGKEGNGIFKNKELVMLIIFAIIGLTVYISYGNILNYLYKRMYGKSTFLVYVPLANIFISVKMAFGGIVSKIFIALYIVSALLAFLNIKFLFGVFNFIAVLAFIVVIIKIATKKYDLLYFEPSMQHNVHQDTDNNSDDNNSFIDNSDVEVPLDLDYSNDSAIEELSGEIVDSINAQQSAIPEESVEDKGDEVIEDNKSEKTVALDEDELYDLDGDDDNNDDDDEKDISDYFK